MRECAKGFGSSAKDAKALEVARMRKGLPSFAMAQRLWRSEVEDIDLIDDIEAIDHIKPRTKAEVAQWCKRAEVSASSQRLRRLQNSE